MTPSSLFHLAIPVKDLDSTLDFYLTILKCEQGRSTKDWVDLNFFGHQLVLHKINSKESELEKCNDVDGKHVPIPHFGAVLKMEEWEILAENLREKVKFEIEPYIRFKREAGEQGTMFFFDPSNNAIEIKGFASFETVFEK